MILPAHLKQILSEDDRKDILSKINSLKATFPKEPEFDEAGGSEPKIGESSGKGYIQNSNMGKIYFHLPYNDFFTGEIHNKINSIVQQIEPGATPHSATYTEYSLKYGTPSLSVHQDRFDIFLLIDLQIDSNTLWPLSANGKDYELEDGDALAIHAGSTDHGRPSKTFVDGEYVSMIFIDFLRPGRENNNG